MKMRACASLAVLVLPLMLYEPVDSADARSSDASDCGVPIYKGDGTVWQCTFADYFGGTSLSTTNWSPLTTKRTNLGTPACLVDDPDNVSVRDGLLHLTIRKEPAPFLCEMIVGGYTTQYTTGGVYSRNKFTQTYGRFETRAAFFATKEPGVKTAIWMWPQGDKAKYGDSSGGIDTAEFWSAQPDVVEPHVHYDNEDNDPNATADCRVDHPENLHTYSVEWTSETIKFFYDGKLCLENNWNPLYVQKPAPFDEAFFMTMNVGFASWAPNYLRAPLPQTMKVDHVKVWS